jgi:hypothetical protein
MGTMEKPAAERASKRRGRPIKTAKKGRITQIGVLVSAATKTLIVQSAKASGRTISREVEHLIERALHYDRLLNSMRTTLGEMEKGNVEAALWRLGFTPVRPFKDGQPVAKEGGGYWTVWAEPGYPGIQRSGFEGWTEEEQAALAERTEPARNYPDEELDAMWAAKQREQQPK